MQKITGLNDIIENYDAILCDIWGVVHNGVEPFNSSVSALQAARKLGKKVVLVTNAPSSAIYVRDHLKATIGISEDFYDDIITSGDVAKSIIDGWQDKKCFHLGLRDIETNPTQPDFSELVDIDKADYVLCTFLARKNEIDLQDYMPLLQKMKARNLPFLCSNPDHVVDVGGVLYFCAGALAKLYEDIDGEVIYSGKPHGVIYEKALDKLVNLIPGIKASQILAIGDGLATDVPGANRLGADMLFIADGIHAREFEQDVTENGKDVFSDEFVSFIEKNIKLRKVDVKYFMAQLS